MCRFFVTPSWPCSATGFAPKPLDTRTSATTVRWPARQRLCLSAMRGSRAPTAPQTRPPNRESATPKDVAPILWASMQGIFRVIACCVPMLPRMGVQYVVPSFYASMLLCFYAGELSMKLSFQSGNLRASAFDFRAHTSLCGTQVNQNLPQLHSAYALSIAQQ